MFHLTLFGGTEGDIAPAGFTALTLFGGAELRRPTIASQLLYLKSRTTYKPTFWDRIVGSDKNLVITLFGGTVLYSPTLVEEYQALAGVIRSGVLTQQECAHMLDRYAGVGGDLAPCRTLTLFGASITRQPSVAKERKALEAATKSGTLSKSIREALDSVIGSPPQAKIRALGNLAMQPS